MLMTPKAAAIPRPASAGEAGFVLFFTPSAGVRPHFLGQLMTSRALAESGHETRIVHCTGVFERCPVMEMRDVPLGAGEAERRTVCAECMSIYQQLNKKFGLPAILLEDHLTAELMDRYHAILEGIPDDLLQFAHDGIAFGKITTMDVTHKIKLYDYTNVSGEVRSGWLEYVRSLLLGYLLCLDIYARYPVRHVLNFSDYSLHYSCRLAARACGISGHTVTFGSHQAIDFRLYNVLSQGYFPTLQRLFGLWKEWRELPALVRDVRRSMDELIFRQSSNSYMVYSSPLQGACQEVAERLGLDPARRTLVAYTSSFDELLVNVIFEDGIGTPNLHYDLTFPDQVAWLRALTQYVDQSDDLQLVVRIHPREGANRRDSVQSSHLAQLQENFARDFTHCRFIWPGDPVSSYDLAELADLVLVAWSTTGLEFARLGAPVLCISSGVTYPDDDFVQYAPTEEGYFATLRRLCGSAPNLETVARAHRFYAASRFGMGFDFGDVIPTPDCHDLPGYAPPLEAASLVQAILGGEDTMLLNHRRHAQALGPDSARAETQELARQIGRYLHFLFTRQDPGDSVQVRYADLDDAGLARLAQETPGTGFIRVQGTEVAYALGEGLRCRRAPLAVRLARLLAAAAGDA